MESAGILIAEDELITGKNLKAILEGEGYRVTGPVRTGEKAIEVSMADPPDPILMDIHLASDMDGIETAARLRAEIGAAVIYLTAHFSEDFIERAKTTHPFGYLIKPFQPAQVRSTIEMALSRSVMEKALAQSAERGWGVHGPDRPCLRSEIRLFMLLV